MYMESPSRPRAAHTTRSDTVAHDRVLDTQVRRNRSSSIEQCALRVKGANHKRPTSPLCGRQEGPEILYKPNSGRTGLCHHDLVFMRGVAAAMVVMAVGGVPACSGSSGPPEPSEAAGRGGSSPTVSSASPGAPSSPVTSVSRPIVCGGEDLGKQPVGEPVRVSVRLGSVTATLTGTTIRPNPSSGTNAFLSGGTVVVRGDGPATRYRIPDIRTYVYRRPRQPQEMTVVGSKDVHGILCLVRFHAEEPAVGLVGVEPLRMGLAPQLALLVPGGRPAQVIRGDFRRYSIDTSTAEPILATGDARFYSAGGAGFDSGFPLRIFTITDGRLKNVSAQYAKRIEADAARWWRQFRHPHHGPRLGALATWAADQCTLGRQAFAFRTLDRLAAARRLHPYPMLRRRTDADFVRSVKRLLVRTGYAS